MTSRTAFLLATLVTGAFLIAGCASTPPVDRPRSDAGPDGQLRVVHHAGGTHYRTIFHDGVWFQTFASTLLVIDPTDGRARDAVELGPVGRTGPAIDMAIARGRLYIVLEHDAIVELSIDRPRQPRVLGTVTADTLGVRPDRLSVIDDELYVSGHGGVVRWSDGRRFLEGDHRVSRVARATVGLVACIDRQVVRLDDADYVGSATDLIELPASAGLPDRLLFIRESGDRTSVGLMSREIREVDVAAGTHAIVGPIRNVRLLGHRVWIVTPDGIHVYGISNRALQLRRFVDVLGAIDVDAITRNQVAVAGTFGRAIYRILQDGNRPGDTFTRAVREAAGLDWVAERGGQVLAGGEAGSWLYVPGDEARVSEVRVEQVRPLLAEQTRASTLSIDAEIIDGGRAVRLSSADNETVYTMPAGATVHSVAGVRGRIWIGTSRGITVLDVAPDGAAVAQSTVRLTGPIRHLVPRSDGSGAVAVSEQGGFSLVELH